MSSSRIYSITKKAAEDLLQSYCNTFSIKYRIMRLCNVLGKNDNKVSIQKNAFQYLIEELKNNRSIELYDYGRFYRDYMDVSDIARAIHIVIERGNLNEIYNIGTGEPYLFKELIDYVIDKTKSTSIVKHIPQKEFHAKVQVKSMYMDTTKLKSLGFVPSKTLFETIDDLL